MKQEKFYQKLSEIPDAPDLFNQIDSRILRRKKIRYIVASVTAVLIISVCIVSLSDFNGIMLTKQPEVSLSVSVIEEELPQEIIDEIQFISDYFNDTTFEYSLLDMYTYMD